MKYDNFDSYVNAIQSLSSNKLYIVGAGKYGKIWGEYFNKHNIPWIGYIDKQIDLKPENGKPVYSYEEIEDGYYVVSSFLYRYELLEELKKHNIEQKKIILYDHHDIFYKIYDDLINYSQYTKKIKIFHQKHLGKRCFIIGNGPSLKLDDLEKLKEEFTFASNTIYALYKHTKWRPTYYCAGDPFFCKQMMSDKKNLKIVTNGCQAAFTSVVGEGFRYRDDIDIKHVYYFCRVKDSADKKLPEFSNDCSEQTYLAGTITYEMLQFAVYMGFKELYLLGMDFNYSVERYENGSITRKNVCNHMKEIEKEEKIFYDEILKRHGETYIADIDLQLAGFQAAKQYCDSHGIKIFNATRGGKLEVFPRINFDSLFS